METRGVKDEGIDQFELIELQFMNDRSLRSFASFSRWLDGW
jgi:hypothetical protein